jgi:hypothetical protein
MENQDAWTLFAAAWLAGRAGDPRTHGEDEAHYAARCAEMAGKVAARMLQIRDVQLGRSSALTRPAGTTLSPNTQRAINDALTAAGLSVEDGGLPDPSAPSNGSQVPPGMCQRRYPDGNPCIGKYDEQGICSACRLPMQTPSERAAQSRGINPGAA